MIGNINSGNLISRAGSHVVSAVSKIGAKVGMGIKSKAGAIAGSSLLTGIVSGKTGLTGYKYAFKKGARKFLRWLSKNFSSPQQRAVLGLTALCIQPFIDLHNKYIKEEDKPVTVAKTIAKATIGTTIGISIRYFAIKAVRNYTKTINTGKYSQCLLPQKIIDTLARCPKSVSERYLINYRNGLGTFLGTMCGLFTNFLIDAPLCKKATNFLHEKVFKKGGSNGK